MIRFSALISLLLLVTSCAKQLYPELQPQAGAAFCLDKLKPVFTTALYNAQVNVTGKHLSGLLLLKTMEDSTTRAVFTSEMGVTFFDFEFRKNGFRVVSCIDQLNKKVVINRLKSDIGLLIMHDIDPGKGELMVSGTEYFYKFKIGNENVIYITDQACNSLNRIETSSKKKKKVVVNLTGTGSGIADSVYLAHQLFEYNITLKKIVR